MTIRKVSIGHTRMKKTGFNCGLYDNTLALAIAESVGSQWASRLATLTIVGNRKGGPCD
jgi:hypothetical protein